MAQYRWFDAPPRVRILGDAVSLSGIFLTQVGAWRSLVARPGGPGRSHPSFSVGDNQVGAWRSLVARFHGVEEVARSNRVAPTRFTFSVPCVYTSLYTSWQNHHANKKSGRPLRACRFPTMNRAYFRRRFEINPATPNPSAAIVAGSGTASTTKSSTYERSSPAPPPE